MKNVYKTIIVVAMWCVGGIAGWSLKTVSIPDEICKIPNGVEHTAAFFMGVNDARYFLQLAEYALYLPPIEQIPEKWKENLKYPPQGEISSETMLIDENRHAVVAIVIKDNNGIVQGYWYLEPNHAREMALILLGRAKRANRENGISDYPEGWTPWHK